MIENEVVIVIKICRNNMFVELSKFARDVIAGAESEHTSVYCIVDKIATAVGNMAIGISITGTPVKNIMRQSVFSGNLRIESGTTAIIIFGTFFLISLRTDAIPKCVPVVAQLVEDVFQLVFVVPVFLKNCHVEHRAQTHIVVVLIVCAVTEIITLVIGNIINAVKIIFHVLVGTELVGIVECGNHSGMSAIDIPKVIVRCVKF